MIRTLVITLLVALPALIADTRQTLEECNVLLKDGQNRGISAQKLRNCLLHSYLSHASGAGSPSGPCQPADVYLDTSADALYICKSTSVWVAIAGGGTDDQVASEVPVTPAGGIAATNVQAALEELDSEKQPADDDLTEIAALSCANDEIAKMVTGAWTCQADATGGGGATTEAGMETQLTDVTDLFTNNDGALDDDDISNDDLGGLQNVTESAPGNDEVLQYVTDHWENQTLAEAGIMAVGAAPTAHAASHSDGGSDEVVATNLASACTDAQVLGGDGLGGVECQTDAGGMSNPMTTAEDLIVGGVGGAPARLAGGAEGQALKIISGQVSWGTDSTGGTPAFSDIASGTNSAAAMVVGTGSSLGTSGSGTITATSSATATTASTASALAANGANCSAGQYPLGVDASGAVESCTADDAGTDDQTAGEVAVTPVGSVEATNVQAAIQELDSEKLATTGTAADSTKVANTTPGAGGLAVLDDATTGDVLTTIGAAASGHDHSGVYEPAGITESDISDLNHTDATKLPLAGGTMTGQLVTDNLGIEFEESDTNPACAAGNFNIFADLSEGKLKKCTDGIATDLDTTGGTPDFGTLSGGTNTTAAMIVGTGASLATSGSGTIAATTSADSAADDVSDDALGGLQNVTEATPADNDVLQYVTDHWENQTLAEAGIMAVGAAPTAHAASHSDGAADEVVATNLASACTDAQVLGGTAVTGGVECQTDDAGTDDQTAGEVAVTPVGSVEATNVQAAIQELDSEKLATTGTAADSTKVANTTPGAGGLAVLDDASVAAVKATLGVDVVDIQVIIDGGGSAITTGIKGDIVVGFACTITQVTGLADQSGSIVVDIWKDTYANYPPTDADSITASAPLTLSTALKAQDATLTGWTTSIAAGDTLRYNVDSAATITRLTVDLKCTR